MSSMPKKILFILGIGRSGSTMLDLMLGSHSEGFSLGDISKLPEIVGRRGPTAQLSPDSTFWQDRFTPEDIVQLAKGFSGRRLHQYVPLKLEQGIRGVLGNDAIFNPYTLLFDKIQKTLLIDSSKYPHWVQQRLQAREFTSGKLEAYVCHLVRDGRAVLNSYRRVFPDRTDEQISRNWLNNFEQSDAIYQAFPSSRRIRVRYEELATETEETVQSVCHLLGMPFEPNMLKYWEGDHHYITGSRSARAMIARYREQPIPDRVAAVHGTYYQNMGLGI